MGSWLSFSICTSLGVGRWADTWQTPLPRRFLFIIRVKRVLVAVFLSCCAPNPLRVRLFVCWRTDRGGGGFRLLFTKSALFWGGETTWH